MAEVNGEAPAALLARADRLRDQRLWDAAAEAYATYLEAEPADWRAMVQRGHAVKEAGDTAGALALYRAAEAIAPDVADTKVQIGGALKRLGDPAGAFAAFADALALDPQNPFAAPELTALAAFADAVPPRPRVAGAALLIVFDASDLLAWFRGNRAPTGIQRVQLNIISRALTNPAEGTATAVAAFDASGGFWREISAALFLRLYRLSRLGAETRDPVWVEAVAEAQRQLAEGADFPFAPGACLVNLGTSWWIKDYFLRVRHAQRRFGIRYIPFIHDCIPLLLPEHCSPALVAEFAQWFAGIAAHADGFLANSACTAADATRILDRVLPGAALPHAVIRLDALPDAASAPDTQALPIPDDEPFVLVVGTIEARKNHLLVFQAWLTLLRKHGPEAVPRLVCVGKPGWLAEPALNLLKASPALAEKVTILHGISDLVLATLYRRAIFSIYNSFYEGWGLPVTESLGHGRAVVLPRHSALIEAGTPGGIFFDPQSEPDLIAQVEPLIFSPEAREAAEAMIARDVTLRDWGAITDEVLRAITRFADAAPQGSRLPAPLAERMPLHLLGHTQPDRAMALADALRDGLGWHPLEDWGCWTLPGRARLRLPMASPVAEPLRLYLGLQAPPGTLPVTLRLRAGDGGWASLTLAPGARQTVFLDVPTGAADALVVGIEAATPQALPARRRGEGKRLVGIGVTAVMLCRRDDLAARIDFLEREHFTAAEVAPGN